jgi:dipeptidyl aminopeptidase/acylaminoacyl peptidase
MTRRIPLEDFFRKPERTDVRLSPGGRWLSWMAPYERRLNVYVRDLFEGGEAVRVTGATERDVMGYVWADDERIVYAQDTAGDENYRLHAVGRDGSSPIDLTPFEGVKCGIVDELEEVEGEILFQMNRRVKEVFDVYRIDVATGEMRCVAENPGNVQTWRTDHQGRVRAATTTDGVATSLLFREREEDDWQAVGTFSFKELVAPLLFTFDDRRLYVRSNVGRDKAAILEVEPRTGEELRLVFEHPEVDAGALLSSRRFRKITGVSYTTGKREYRFFDERRERIQRFLDERLPGHENRLASHSRDERRYVVHSGGDRTQGSYWLLDVPDEPGEPTANGEGGMRLEHLFDAAPWLVEEELAEMRPIRYTSRDGLSIHGYLTLPAGREPRSLPLVVHPHGGPWHRDVWGFDPELQFLANRGLAVLQMNFRGSTGYGRAFWEAGFREWGLAMQDDVTDGARWAIEQKIADPKRIAIYGGSYGGYATLAGVTKTPDLYACAISYVGVSNLFTWIQSFPPYWKPFLEMVYEMVGHPEHDAEQWRATSPLFQADRIRVPLFVAQGAQDPRVKKEESDQIVAALREHGVPVEYLVKENEGHGFSNEENQFEFYRAMEAFLTEHLGLER